MATIALNVPRARKDEAKALGARWNGFKKTWYVAVGTDLSPFKALGFYDVDEPESPAADGENAMRKLTITRQQFMDLKLGVTEFDDDRVLIDAGEHGLFIGHWNIEVQEHGDIEDGFMNLMILPTGSTRKEWIAENTVKKEGELTYPSRIGEHGKVESKGKTSYVLSDLLAMEDQFNAADDGQEFTNAVTVEIEIEDIVFADETATA